ncbi:MAG: hypothetical protein UX88_C0001G0004 [Candidatus Woesebacteria bacterium GW2011_GWC2_47_16]|uniref:Polymerase III, delta prime subunit protein n=8 Tax=Candidatus Woeseibacteriota TaxID=1752722 RepID=A0A0G1T193_9BACT|nr:MAG: hypothetical protein UX03_C0003G0047 [Candidatus Woesebacteria bacterium GW2011_GWE1_45_18]KKU25183.1 MAG: hypothetical protein UX34_C0002G0046 [Candidatus Woesebacteria bacterium GW2011_GWF1_46_13]KKU47978.1 MAG: hypothetical protein UX67_C0025G0004 [Candidatus Woesebacteria bacterium GW2011_GWF2_46_8]KKU65344.1 MAG: hypothetical protein UX88_C0001G0004 [Candidatus Woesebacteria bacterium GW2011_GWC2_47_16]KKU70764.1 MAG: hypothetical protein UX95_C0016G0003 [Candidatus Woesebacteria b
MHAFLIEGGGETLEKAIEALVKNLKAKLFVYPVAKIEDVRSLNSFISLALATPTAILLRGVDQATDEALNAFLKNLEEPQENLYFILTAASHHRVLPTVVSRCQIVKTRGNQASQQDKRLAVDFLKKSVGEKISFVEPIKDREAATEFVSALSLGLHELLRQGEGDYRALARGLTASLLTRERLKANGNVTLQLTNLVISF